MTYAVLYELTSEHMMVKALLYCSGGGMKLCPEAKLDDGLLDITYVQNVEPDKVPELMQVVLAGKKEDELSESIRTMRVSWLEVALNDYEAQVLLLSAVLACHHVCGELQAKCWLQHGLDGSSIWFSCRLSVMKTCRSTAMVNR